MDMYGGNHHDYSLYLLDLGAVDPALMESLYSTRSRTSLIYGSRYYTDDGDDVSSVWRSSDRYLRNTSPPPKHHRHDGSSPLPLGMDWSPPPHVWDGRNTVWPHDHHTGWSYCVTIPFWSVTPSSWSSDYIVFYRVQVGIQSPEGITSLRGIMKRFNDFLNLFSELKKLFPKKKLPPAPSKHRLRSKSKDLLEERRSVLEDWITILLSDIDVSRSFAIATFLELEAAARLFFHNLSQDASDGNYSSTSMVPSGQILVASDNSLLSDVSLTSDLHGDYDFNASELESPRIDTDNFHAGRDTAPVQGSANLPIADVVGLSRNDGVSPLEKFVPGQESLSKKVLMDTLRSEINSAKLESPEDSEASRIAETLTCSDSDFRHDLSIVVPTEEQHKMEKVLAKLQQRMATSKIDVEDLIARLHQELAVRQYLSTKVKDLEIELETTKQNKEEMVQQAVIIERERVTQIQWDMEELRKKCVELELNLKGEQEERVFLDSAKMSLVQENESLQRELDVATDRFEELQKQFEESESKSKLDIKVLAKEIKSLRGSQSELREELSAMTKEKVEIETILQEERKRRERANAANSKLLHECEILRSRLEECSMNFQIGEENKLTVEASSPCEAVDMLSTSDNRIGLLLAEAQLLAQDMESTVASSSSYADGVTDDDKLRKMVTDVFIDNACLRKKINSILRYAHIVPETSDKNGGETSSKDTVLGKFLER